MAVKLKKIECAAELYKTMPNVSVPEFQAVFAKKYKGEMISSPAVYAARRLAGITAKAKRSSAPDPQIENLTKVMALVKANGGFEKVRDQLTVIKELADRTGGLVQLEDTLSFLQDLFNNHSK